ncbi:MAG: peptide chain release factor N(5)-glutamine methyltransferase [Alphaproteobacteria bacterium]|nr:peptide chain release factor N(5)-glutamine methyltransferase [Alphaproteobacteria bacterium]
MPTYNDLYQSFKKRLAHVDTPDLDARVLICALAGLDQADFIVKRDKIVDTSVEEAVEKAIKRRLKGEPVSKILGAREFWGLDFKVTEHTLSPRPETEIIIERALKWLDREGRLNEKLSILDLGTGTGCIPISLLSELPNATAVAADKSPDALNVAKENAQNHKMIDRITFIESDWFSNLENKTFDLIVSNPPYIPESDIESLPKEVRNHDPILALIGGVHGLDPYEIIFSKINTHLKQDGRAFFEIGQNQLSGIMRLVDESNIQLCDSVADLAGIPRVVEITRGDK